MSLRKTNKYNFVLDYIRAKGISVRHARLSKKVAGQYDFEKKNITIDNSIKGTVFGCATLFHEYRHWYQDKHNLFPQFMRGYDTYKPKYMQEIVCAEQDAAKFAERMVRGLGLSFSAQELDKDVLEELKEDWKKWHFD